MPERPGLDVLNQLYADLRRPSYRKITEAAQRHGHFGRNENGIGRATFSDLLRGKTEPKRETVEAFVVGCLAAGRPIEGLAAEKLRADYWLRAFDAAVLTPVADAAGFGDQPSQMLVAENEIVEFTGRADELAELTAWRDGEARLSALWLHGPGGQGKTRLGRRFATESAAAGWRVEASWGATDQRGSGLLVVVDYADRMPHTDLVALFDRHANPRRRTRILLLARSTSPWPALRHELASRNAASVDLPLPALAATVADRSLVFTMARDSFARALGVPDADMIIPPADLDHPDLGLALSLHVAALVAVDAHRRQITPPAHPGDLSAYLLDREEAHWVRLLQRPDFRTVPHAMRRAVFAACLIGARPYAEAARALTFVQDAQTMLMDHSYCYPAAPGHVLQPLLPDRLAEDFLALTLRAQQWAVADLETLLARPADGTAPTGVDRAITFLAAASTPGRHPDVAPHLEALLLADPQLAVDAGGAALTALTHLDHEVLAQVADTFPSRAANLDVGMLAVVELVVAGLLDDADAAEKVSLLVRLATRAWQAGAVERAGELCREAIVLARALPADPSDQLGLAIVLSDISEVLVATGSTAEGAEIAEVALRLLGAADPAEDHSAHLVGPLVVLGIVALSDGDHERALDLFTQAAEHAPRADERHGRGGVAKAAALIGLGNALSVGDRFADALPVLREALAAFDALRLDHPMVFEAERSTVQSQLAACLFELGQTQEGEFHRREALATASRLAALNPAAHSDGYVSTLLLSAFTQADAGDFRAAEALARQAVDIARGHHPALVGCLTVLANILDRADEWKLAWPVLDEASEIAVRLGVDQLLAGLLTRELDDHATRLDKAGRVADLVVVRRRVAELVRSSVGRHAGARDQLARRLDELGKVLLADGQLVEAESVLREAVAIREQQGDPEPLARTLGILGVVLDAAAAPAAEVVDLLTRAVADHPGRHGPTADRMMFAGALLGLLSALMRTDSCADAAAHGEQWVEFLAETALTDPELADYHVFVRSLLSSALCLSDQVSAGVAQADRALAASVGVSNAARAAALHAFAFSRIFSAEDIDEALAANSESIALFTLESQLDAAHQIRARLLELAD